jgi:hypothetical protein
MESEGEGYTGIRERLSVTGKFNQNLQQKLRNWRPSINTAKYPRRDPGSRGFHSAAQFVTER